MANNKLKLKKYGFQFLILFIMIAGVNSLRKLEQHGRPELEDAGNASKGTNNKEASVKIK